MRDTDAAIAARNTREQLDDALSRKDRMAAVDTALSAVREGRLGIDELYTRVLAPLLIDTGSAWSQGRTEVWEEHFATATVRTIVEALYPSVVAAAADIPRNGKSIVLACPSGEAHDLGLRMLTDRLTLAGWTAHFLGADTPTGEIVAAARGLHADVVALSVATHYNRAMLREVIGELKHELPGVRVGVGGPAFSHDRSWPADELIDEHILGLDAAAAGAGAAASSASPPATPAKEDA